jgi:hypothetical protein
MNRLHNLLLATSLLVMPSVLYAQDYRVGDVVAPSGATMVQVPLNISGTRTTKGYVTLYAGTPTDSALPGIHYVPVSRTFEVLPTDARLLFEVPVFPTNVAKMLTVKAVINKGGTLRDGTGRVTLSAPPPIIVVPEPPIVIPPTTCPDGSQVPYPQTCPVPPAPISVPDKIFNESEGLGYAEITRSGGDLSKEITVTYHLDDNTAKPGSDYERIEGTATLAAGQAILKLPFTIHDDSLVEGKECLNMLVTASTAPILDGKGEYCISDNDLASPPITPGPVTDNLLVTLGDSISVKHSGNYVGTYCASRAQVTCTGLAVGGKTLVTMQPQFDQALTLKPEVAFILPGANDLGDKILYPTTQAWADYLFSRLAPLRAAGIKVGVGTTLQQINNTNHNTRVPEARTIILGAVGTKIDFAVDLSEANGPFTNPANFLPNDPVHPSYSCGYGCGGQGIIATRFQPAADTALGLSAPPVTLPPTTGWVPSPSLDGLVPVPSNFDVNLAMKDAPIPASGAPDVVGAFRFICEAGQISNDDPILYPGQPGRAHLHQFYGNTQANAHSTYDSLRTKGGSGCNQVGDEFNPAAVAINRSAYWMPAMLDGKGNVVRPDYVSIYYKQRPATDPVVSDPSNPKYQGKAIPLPHGIRFIFGWDPTGLNQIKTGGMWFNCQGPTARPGSYTSLTTALANCPAGQGNQVGAIISAPDCWDGKNLDSPDHRSHVSYISYGSWGYPKCPSTHPYVIPTFTMGAWYTVAAGDDGTIWELSSDPMAPGQPKGHTFHADFFMAWGNEGRNGWQSGCLAKLLNCSSGNMGNGKVLVEAGQPRYNGVLSWKHPNRLFNYQAAGLTQMGR